MIWWNYLTDIYNWGFSFFVMYAAYTLLIISFIAPQSLVYNLTLVA